MSSRLKRSRLLRSTAFFLKSVISGNARKQLPAGPAARYNVRS
jgi:hypothetical protein